MLTPLTKGENQMQATELKGDRLAGAIVAVALLMMVGLALVLYAFSYTTQLSQGAQ